MVIFFSSHGFLNTIIIISELHILHGETFFQLRFSQHYNDRNFWTTYCTCWYIFSNQVLDTLSKLSKTEIAQRKYRWVVPKYLMITCSVVHLIPYLASLVTKFWTWERLMLSNIVGVCVCVLVCLVCTDVCRLPRCSQEIDCTWLKLMIL